MDVAEVTPFKQDVQSQFKAEWLEKTELGDEIFVFRINVGPIVPENLSITITSLRGSVTFDDGTITRTITSADFNEFGEYMYFIVTTSGDTCHRVTFEDMRQ